VDGHNTLFQLESLFGSSFENGAPRRKSRQLLGEHLVALAKAYPSLVVELWFDSDEPSDIAIDDRVTVHYSGGKGPDRADKRIIEYFKFLSIKKPYSCCVLVTADQSESAQAQANGAKVIAPYELGLLGIGIASMS
jgi:predicted RNA-binding protein with PIN domain